MEDARTTGVAASSGRLPLGIGSLDRQLEGGLPAGSVVAYCAPPASQSELLLYEFTARRETLYLTTDRSEDAVADALGKATCPTGDPEVRFVPGDAPLENARRMVRGVGEETNVIIDTGDLLERTDRGRYQRFLNELGNHMQNTGSLAFLHCMRTDTESDLRATTQHMADVVFDLYQERHGTEVETRLGVPKFRGGRALSETIKLELEERVRVDTSRDIA
jgi:KaiC/GvpD/RAD55 family RecA-like ATPase